MLFWNTTRVVNDNYQQQNEIQCEYPPEDGLYQVIFFDCGCSDNEFKTSSFTVSEYRLEKSCRFLFVCLLNVEVCIVVLHPDM